MAATPITELKLKTWSLDITKGFIASTVWGQFSNINKETAKLPHDREGKVPKTAIHYLSTEFKNNAFETTIPLLKSLVSPGVGGLQVAKGTGEKPQTRWSKAWYNFIRKAINSSRHGVDLKSVEYLKLAKKDYMLLGDWFKQDEDYAFQMALCEGADIYLVEPKYWADYEVQNTPPTTRLIHPNVCFPGMSKTNMPALSTNNATYMGNIANSLALLTDAKGFDYAALDALMTYARSHIKPIEEGETQYIALLSSVQAAQLRKDPEFLSTNMAADKRGADNRALSGVIGTWQGFKFIEDLRSPIFHIDEAKRGFEYVTYANGTTVDRFSGIAALGRKTKAAAGTATGTCEVARILGNAAIGVPMVDGSSLKFQDEPTDFGAQNEICGMKYSGHCRLDFRNSGGTIVENESSALFFTATPTGF